MNKILFTIPAYIFLLASCTSVEDEPKMQEDLVPIAPNVVSDLMVEANNQTRGYGIDNDATIGVVVWDLNKTSTTIANTDLSGNAPKSSTTVLTNISVSNANLALSPAQYYNANENYNSFMFAYYPATGNDGAVLATSGNRNTITFNTKDGTIDVCASAMGSANKSSSQPTLTLQHKTAWITFMVKKDASVTSETKVTRIWLTGATVPGSMTFAKSGSSVTASSPVSLKDAYNNSTGKILTTTASEAKNYDLFICPPVSAGTVKINATTVSGGVTTTYKNVDLKNSAGTANLAITAGNHYTVTLTFKQQEITPTISVTAWSAVSGTATIQ